MSGRDGFLPTQPGDLLRRGWDAVDFVLVTGDAYVDHPSFAMAVIGRVLEAEGYRVAILAQPDWRSSEAVTRFGRPRLAFLISAGNLDSMVNRYTAAKKPRSQDVYAPGGAAGRRPDRATIVYANLVRAAYGRVPIVIGGVEPSLRRFSHYDYWEDSVRRSILVDSGADLLVFGMGERAIAGIAARLAEGEPISALREIPGTCWTAPLAEAEELEAIRLPAHEEVASDPRQHARAFRIQEREQDPVRGRRLIQACGGRAVVQNPPAMPLDRGGMDRTYALPYQRMAHPDYDAEGGVPALEEVSFSITANRGCYGSCAFCAIGFHQGRIVTSRSPRSVIAEGRVIAAQPGFKGFIHDVGGPTANFRAPACEGQLAHGACAGRSCLFPEPCPKLRVDHREMMDELRALRGLPGVKKVFVRSGIRYDVLMRDPAPSLLTELCEHHISGQLKVAPEHVSRRVLRLMGKPAPEVFERFADRYAQTNVRLGKEQYLVPYFISGHPGATIEDAVELAVYMKRHRLRPEQVQDFYPTPGTRATVMYHTGLDPATLKPVYIPRDPREKAMQRALLQYYRPENAPRVRAALRAAGHGDLIGFGPGCLVRPEGAPAKPRRGGGEARDLSKPGPTAAKAGGTPRSGGKPKKPAAGGKRRGGEKGKR